MKFSRSKGGCKRCRSQKKKCDQTQPACSKCVAASQTCIYPDATDSPPSRSGRSASSTINTSNDSYLYNGFSADVSAGNLLDPTRVGDIDWTSDASFLQAFTDVASVLPIPDLSFPNIDTIPGGNPANPANVPAELPSTWSTALLSVPLDCDPALWASFVDSSLWESRPSSTSTNDRPLLEHFTRFASTTVVVVDSQDSASKFYQELATRATQENQQALMHAILAVSAQHLSNLARKSEDEPKALLYGDESSKQRGLALHTLRIALAGQRETGNDDLELRPSVMLLLVLAAILKGDGDIIVSYLSRASSFIHGIENPARGGLLPTCSALHSIYFGLHSVSRGKQLNIASLFPQLTNENVWHQRADQTVETLLGVRRDMLLFFFRAHSLVIEYQTVSRGLERNPDDDELMMMQLGLKSDCSIIEADLKDEKMWEGKWLSNCDERIRLAHEFYRLAIRVMLMTKVFEVDVTSARVQQCVTHMLNLGESVHAGREIGLMWPFMLVCSAAIPQHRSACLKFIDKCQWKGSAGPRIAEKVVRTIWERRDAGIATDCVQVTMELGSPLLV
ncbi:uncharacterized protein I303_106486 [Kwoniella dejecticola CBS 10117]|uniref:Zn(2)-C6 fungal-type domain-containing protein n=1 Tax=Kwoniella dejecticola CBS 10117 TaxID=1296121 RepID=A0A1A5ZUK4_9TREE|nr:uncharacterized protein I303_08256 [Kwoniella dejecticola CBS 10117]OBR81486.1 hypothetical protein I303_08256 [Kwoniella dejecticola CBS 10117]